MQSQPAVERDRQPDVHAVCGSDHFTHVHWGIQPTGEEGWSGHHCTRPSLVAGDGGERIAFPAPFATQTQQIVRTTGRRAGVRLRWNRAQRHGASTDSWSRRTGLDISRTSLALARSHLNQNSLCSSSTTEHGAIHLVRDAYQPIRRFYLGHHGLGLHWPAEAHRARALVQCAVVKGSCRADRYHGQVGSGSQPC